MSRAIRSRLPRVFVSGASGFVGAQVVHHLLEAGYPVRAAARGKKVELLREAFFDHPSSSASFDGQFEVVEVPDIASSDLSSTLEGIGAIVHTASPLPGYSDAKSTLHTAIEGSLHILREAVKARIKRVVIIGSMVSFPRGGPFGIEDWNPVTIEQALQDDRFITYHASKKFAEQAVFEYADRHSELDVTILSPSTVLGPFPPGFDKLVPSPDFHALSTNRFIYTLLRPDNEFYPRLPGIVDVRDVARAVTMALTSKTTVDIGHRKRFLITSPHSTPFKDALAYIREAHPELKNRLADPEKAPQYPAVEGVKREGFADAVGFTKDDYTPWKDTVLDAVNSLVKIEKGWKDAGFDVRMPTEFPL